MAKVIAANQEKGGTGPLYYWSACHENKRDWPKDW